MTAYNYTMPQVNSDYLTLKIRQSNIIIALDHIDTVGTSISIFFKTDLNLEDIAILNDIVTSYDYASPVFPIKSVIIDISGNDLSVLNQWVSATIINTIQSTICLGGGKILILYT